MSDLQQTFMEATGLTGTPIQSPLVLTVPDVEEMEILTPVEANMQGVKEAWEAANPFDRFLSVRLDALSPTQMKWVVRYQVSG